MSEASYAHAESVVREADRDRWLSGLFADAALRPHLYALFAFNVEIARVRDFVRDPIPGEIRLAWWRETVEGHGRGDVHANPVADALLDTINRFHLPTAPFVGLLEARVFDLYDDPMPSVSSFEGYAGETASTLFQLAALILNEGRDPGTADVAGHGGIAYALTGLMQLLGFHARRGQVFLPADRLARHGVTPEEIRASVSTASIRAALADLRGLAADHLTKARGAVAGADPRVLPAFLPLALVRPRLERLARGAPFDLPAPEGLARQWRLWRAAGRARRGRSFF